MKQSEIIHILDNKNTHKKEKVLVFNGLLADEGWSCPTIQPRRWQHVRHIAGNYYYAWNGDPLDGNIYKGEWVDEE